MDVLKELESLKVSHYEPFGQKAHVFATVG